MPRGRGRTAGGDVKRRMGQRRQRTAGCLHLATRLDGKVTPVNVISQEEVPRLCRITAYFKKLHEIKVLPMNVSTDGDRGIDFQYIGLIPQDLCSSPDDEQSLIIGQSSLSIEVILEKGNVRLSRILV